MSFVTFPVPTQVSPGVEIATLFNSSDQTLRTAAKAFQRICETPPNEGRILLVQSIPGGGAVEVARHLALVACRAIRRPLVGLSAQCSGSGTANQVVLGQFDSAVLTKPRAPDSLFILFSHSREALDLPLGPEVALLKIPPLASRPDDALAAAIYLGATLLPPGTVFSKDALELIRDFFWPGDLAHMRITLGLAGQIAFEGNVQVIDGTAIIRVLQRKERNLADLCRLDHSGWSFSLTPRDLLHLAAFRGFARVRQALELLLIEGAVASGGGNSAAAAKFLGLPYTTLVSRQKVLKAALQRSIH